jgi:hypothetical protein
MGYRREREMRLGRVMGQAGVLTNPSIIVPWHSIVQNGTVEYDLTFRMRIRDLEHQIGINIGLNKWEAVLGITTPLTNIN